MKTTDYPAFLKAFRTLDDIRWKLVEKKYKHGLTADEHENLDWLAGWTWHHRGYVKDHDGNHKLERAFIQGQGGVRAVLEVKGGHRDVA